MSRTCPDQRHGSASQISVMDQRLDGWDGRDGPDGWGLLGWAGKVGMGWPDEPRMNTFPCRIS